MQNLTTTISFKSTSFQDCDRFYSSFGKFFPVKNEIINPSMMTCNGRAATTGGARRAYFKLGQLTVYHEL